MGARSKTKSTYTVIMDDDERQVLRAFGRRPSQCIHQLHAFTGIAYRELLGICNKLVNQGMITPAPDLTLGKPDYQFTVTGGTDMSEIQFIEERLSPLIGLSETAMVGRVLLLKRMKKGLIPEWHPAIDILLSDYERDLKRMERAREPPDYDEVKQIYNRNLRDDEPDCQDRDFDNDPAV